LQIGSHSGSEGAFAAPTADRQPRLIAQSGAGKMRDEQVIHSKTSDGLTAQPGAAANRRFAFQFCQPLVL
jgi:hypothetical protein